MATGENDYDPGYDGSNTTGFVSPAADATGGHLNVFVQSGSIDSGLVCRSPLPLALPRRHPRPSAGRSAGGVWVSATFIGDVVGGGRRATERRVSSTRGAVQECVQL